MGSGSAIGAAPHLFTGTAAADSKLLWHGVLRHDPVHERRRQKNLPGLPKCGSIWHSRFPSDNTFSAPHWYRPHRAPWAGPDTVADRSSGSKPLPAVGSAAAPPWPAPAGIAAPLSGPVRPGPGKYSCPSIPLLAAPVAGYYSFRPPDAVGADRELAPMPPSLAPRPLLPVSDSS